MSLTVHQWTPRVFQLQDKYSYCATLVVGCNQALLFDTMSGTGGLLETIREITPLPLTVVNSHGHLDHTAGNVNFEQVYMHPDDWALITKYYDYLPGLPEEIKTAHSRLVEWASVDGHLRSTLPCKVFDLGGIVLQTVPLAGHTPGSIGLYCPQEHILLSGDALSPQMCLFFPESLPIQQYLETIKYVQSLDVKFFMTGHHIDPLPVELLHRFAQCADLALSDGKSVPYVYPEAPTLTGKAYFLDYYNEIAGGPICFIGKNTKFSL